MAINDAVIIGDTSTLLLKLESLDAADPDLEFSSGSFNGSVDERRVCTVRLAIPGASQEFTLRLEFTDPTFATVDLFGRNVYLTPEDRVAPFQESKEAKLPGGARRGT